MSIEANLPGLTVIIPAFNEEEGIGATLDQLIPVAKQNNISIIVINDGSSDKTGEIVKTKEVRLISHPKNSVNTDEKIETLASSQDESKAVADENEADKSDAAESTREGNTELVVRALLKGLGIEADSAQVVNETLKYLELSQAYPNFESRIPLSLWLDVTLGLKPTLVNLKTPADIRALRIAILQFREIRANKTDALNVRLDGRLKDALQKLSRETGKPVSRLVGNAINVAYETYKADGSSPLIDDVNTRPPRNTPTQALNVRIDQTTKEHLDELVDEFDSIPTAVTTNIIENLIRVFQEEE
jgi:glycosyltransferase involved in cell wall biosynthesis